jgi:1,2-phenylacetyl-CoA epoxidase catalytic subunit
MYSLEDLVDQSKGRLVPVLQQVMKEYIKHITETCQVSCTLQRG